MCEKFGRTAEAARYKELAARCWRKAAASDRDRELEVLRNEVGSMSSQPAERRHRGTKQPVLAALDATQASLQPGDRPGPYSSVVVTGSKRGTSHCFICETADKPAIIIFARSQSDALGKLASGINKALRLHKDADLRSWITFLYADQTSVDAQIVQWSQKHSLTNIPLAVFEDLGGPPSYRLNSEDDITVLLFVNQKVTGNFTFRQGELSETRIAEVLVAVAELVKK